MNLVLVDDDRIVRQSLKVILEREEDIKVLALGQDYDEALALYREHQPDILLMDIRMGEKTGLDAAETLLNEFPDASILFLTTFSDRDYIARALKIGAKGYLLKQEYEGIAATLRAVAAGQTVFGPAVMNALPQVLSPQSAGEAPQDLPSKRELEIWALCAQGLNNREIAQQLFLSEGTVRNHVSALLQKTGLRDRTQLALQYKEGAKGAQKE